MAVWSARANNDMAALAQRESAAAVNSIRAPISQWADTVHGQSARQFQGTLRFPVNVAVKDGEILSVENR